MSTDAQETAGTLSSVPEAAGESCQTWVNLAKSRVLPFSRRADAGADSAGAGRE